VALLPNFPDAVPALAEALKDEREFVRENAANALRRIRSQQKNSTMEGQRRNNNKRSLTFIQSDDT
jgi:HEAT repeat protein